MKVGLVIGHTVLGADKGAYSSFLGLSESEYWKKVVCFIPTFHKGNTIVCYSHSNDKKLDYYGRQLQTANSMNSQDFDLVVELHFNSATPQAHGTETLYYFSSEKGKEAAKIFSDEVGKEFPQMKLRGDEGSKPLVSKDDRGARFVIMQKAPAIIFEPFFGSNKEDCEAFSDPKTAAKIILMALDSVAKLWNK